MRYLRGLEALRNDPQVGNKLLIASLLMFIQGFIPVLPGVVVIGWLTVAMRQAAQGQDSPLPPLTFDFELLGKYLGIGFKPFLAQLLWMLPAVVIFIGFYVAGIAIAMAGVGIAGEDGAPLVVVVMMALMGLAILGSLLLVVLPLQAALIRVELTDNLNEALSFGPILSMTRLLVGELLLGAVVLGLASFALILGGMLVFCVGVYPAQVVAYALQHFYRAELYGRYLDKGGEPLPIASIDLGVSPDPSAPTTF